MSSKSSPTGNTPHVKASAFHSTPNTPVVQQSQQQQQQQDANTSDASTTQFPPPQTFDILPSLHALLARLISAQTKGGGVGDSTSAGPTESVGGGAGDGMATGPLDPKVLVTESSAIKIRIQKARAAVEGLPDVDRTVGQQEEEIAELERRIERLKEVIGDFGQKSTKAMNGGDMAR